MSLTPSSSTHRKRHRDLLELVGKDTINEFRNGKFPRLKPGVAGVGFCSEGVLGVRARWVVGRGEGSGPGE